MLTQHLNSTLRMYPMYVGGVRIIVRLAEPPPEAKRNDSTLLGKTLVESAYRALEASGALQQQESWGRHQTLAANGQRRFYAYVSDT